MMNAEGNNSINPALPRDSWTPARYRAAEMSKASTRRLRIPTRPDGDPTLPPAPPGGP